MSSISSLFSSFSRLRRLVSVLLLVVKGVLMSGSSVTFAYDFLIAPVGLGVAGVPEPCASLHVKSRGGLGLGEGGRAVEENNGVLGLVNFCFLLNFVQGDRL